MRLFVDASSRGWAAVLKQQNSDGLWLPCIYVSRQFNPAQRKYSATDRETLGVVKAARTLGKYVIGNPRCTIYNDHKAVSALINRDPIDLSAKQSRWLSSINDWGLCIRWKPAARNPRVRGGRPSSAGARGLE